MFDSPKPNEFDNWVCVMERGTEYEIEIAKSFLADLDIPANILSKRDSSYSLNVGDMALVYLYVPKEYEDEARDALDEIELKGEDENEEEQ